MAVPPDPESSDLTRSAPDAIELLDPEDVVGIGLGSDILIVDDDRGNLVAYEAALAPLGRRLVLVQSGTAALAAVLEQDFALLLLDVTMPGMSGIETARLIRERPRCAGAPIIFITGASTSPELILEAYEVGAFDFVVKPVLPDVLRAKANVYLQLQERTQLLLRYTARLREAHAQLVAHEAQRRDGTALAAITRRLEKLQEATAALAEAQTPADVGKAITRLGAEAVDATSACMWIEGAAGSFVVEGSHNVPDAFLSAFRTIPRTSDLPLMRAVERREPVWVETEADYAREAPVAYERARAANRAWAFAALPLESRGRVIAVVTFTYGGEHVFTDEERRFLGALMRPCEHALERALLFEVEASARREAEALSQRKDEFLAMLGHELRNPLAAMVTALDVVKLRDGALGRELTIVDRQVGHLTYLIDDLIDVARITRGHIELQREAVDVGPALSEAIESQRPLLDRHELHVDVAHGLLVDADRHRFGQVLINVLSNAAKYTPGSGRIEISAQPEPGGRFARIIVRDNGRGITADLLPILFEPFVQGKRSPGRVEGGLGIGLTLVRNVVELHGGSIEAHSDGANLGATFVVRWPCASRLTRTAESWPIALPGTTRGRRVLIVDGNADAAEVLASLLRTLGHEVALARDGESAVDLARTFVPEIALLDVGVPELDGYALAPQIRALPGCATTAMFAVTSYGHAEERERSRRAGFAHHLVKPVDADRLHALLLAHGRGATRP